MALGMGTTTPRARTAIVLLAVFVLADCSGHTAVRREAQRQVKAAVQALSRANGVRKNDEVAQALRAFYEGDDYQPIWIDGRRPKPAWDALLEALAGAEREGLDPRRYEIEALRARRTETTKPGLLRRDEIESSVVGETEVHLSRAFLAYASHLVNGELDPTTLDASWVPKPRKADLAGALERVRATGDVQGALDALAPHHPGYLRLRAALEKARTESPDRRRQIELNLERWRWLPEDLGARHIVVNIPSYELRLVEQGRETLRMRVVVGKRFNPTPVFSDEITYITFSPKWNVPETILTDEILPALRKDDSYLEAHDMEIVKKGKVVDAGDVDLDDPKSFQVRQRSGDANALGLVKFVFPNQFDVYLHDTPADALFSRSERALSHGCVRVEKPGELAEQLLRDEPKWDRAAIDTAMHSGEEQSVTLKQPVPVHIVYWTAWTEEDGSVRYADDVYGLDRLQAAALDHARPERRAATR
jgi:murein L,D-transpeptidase YcbB/YkuD